MPKVVRRKNANGELESLDDLLRRFRRQVNDANILGECRKRESFVSNGEKKKEKKMKRLMAIRKAQAEARRAEYRDNYLMNANNQNYNFGEFGEIQTVNVSRRSYRRNDTIKAPVAPTAGNKQQPTKPAYYSYRKPAPTSASKEEGK